MKKLRILIISHMFPSKMLKRHGIFMCREAHFLAQFGIQCDFLVARPWAPWPLYNLPRWSSYGPLNPLCVPQDLQVREVRYIRLPGGWFRRFEGWAIGAAVRQLARRWHRQHPFDIVLSFPLIPDAEASVGVAEDLNLPLAVLAIGSDVMVYPADMPVLHKRIRRILDTAKLSIGVSKSICKQLSHIGGYRCEPLCVYLGREEAVFLPAGDKRSLREALNWNEDDIVGVYVGLISESKGMAELAVASERLLAKYPRFRLVCVGDGPAMHRLIALQDQTVREDAVELVGQVAPEEVPAYLQASDFMVFPSHSEGMPQAVIEAMNCGLPVVATKVGGTPEAVLDGETGLLVEAKDVTQLHKAMGRMICDGNFRFRAGRRGHEFARNKFGAEGNAQKLAEALWDLK